MRAPIRTKSKIAIILMLVFSLSMLTYKFSGIYRGTKFSGARTAKVFEKSTGHLAPSGDFTVKQIYDGDTVGLSDGTVLRYSGVDTPEKTDTYFPMATSANTNLIAGKNLNVQFCTVRQSDKYGRRLGTVYADGKDVSLELLREGMGRVYSDLACVPAATLDGYWQASIEAYREKKGVWADRPASPAGVSEAASLQGKSAAVCADVRNVFRGPQAIHINFGKDESEKFSATVFLRDEKRFKEAGIAIENSLVGKKLAVFGHIVNYEGPNMVISSPLQWKMTDDCKSGF